MKKNILEVKSNKAIAHEIFELKLLGDFKKEEFLPGKFLHIKCSDSIHPLLRRPMSICDITDDEKEMTVLYRVEGAGTRLLGEKKIGDRLDVLAPLGTSYSLDIQAGEKVFLVGGGIGIPPLYYLGKELKKKGAIIKSFLGFSSKSESFYIDEFKTLGEVAVATVDGSLGHKGFITDKIDESFDALYSCGPTPMFKTLQKIIPEDKKSFIAMEERMGCGVGACLACVCKPNSKYFPNKSYFRACKEGPVFKLHDLEL
jgi:dihydroorotate dehydrogenase electron transfer subunit